MSSSHSTLISDAYLSKLASRGYQKDTAQFKAVQLLDGLAAQLQNGTAKKPSGLFGRFFKREPEKRGVYMWGGVGRGKSFVMDLFYDVAPTERKLRIHFHEFMKETQRAVDKLTGQENPLDLYAQQMAERYDLICFDEFHVSDAVESMFMGKIFESLMKTSLFFCLTSNYEPDGLYPDGRNRQYLVPAIDKIKTCLDVVNVDSGNDYRQNEFGEDSYYFTPHSAEVHATLERLYRKHNGSADGDDHLTLLGRRVEATRCGTNAVWFNFEQICGGPRSFQDYLDLSNRYPVVVLENVPAMTADMSDEARRFTWLIDILYDHKNILFISAAAMPDFLYMEGTKANEFFRTASRLTEMQTPEYVEAAVKARKARAEADAA